MFRTKLYISTIPGKISYLPSQKKNPHRTAVGVLPIYDTQQNDSYQTMLCFHKTEEKTPT